MTDQIILKRAPLDEYILAGKPYYMRNTHGGLSLRVSDYDFYPQGDEYIEKPQLPSEVGSVIKDVYLKNGEFIPLLILSGFPDGSPWLNPNPAQNTHYRWEETKEIESFTLAKVVPA